MKSVKKGSTSDRLCSDFHLIDLWKPRNPGIEFLTYHRGRKRVDFCIASTSLVATCENMIYEPFHYRLSGDHRGFYMDFPSQRFFSNIFLPTAHLSQRRLCSNDRKSVGKYIQAVYGYLIQHLVFHKMQTLIDSKKPNHMLLEQLDREITRACQHGENICKARMYPSIF